MGKYKSKQKKRRKQMDVRVKTDEDRLFWKIAGVGFLAFAAFSVAALASFDWECVASLAEVAKPQTNLVGVVGNTFAYFGYTAFGLAIWCLPFVLVIAGIKVLGAEIPKEVEEIPNLRIFVRMLGFALMVLVVTGLFQLCGKWTWVRETMVALHVGEDAGGCVGRVFMTECLERGVAAFGATFVSVALLVIALCMALGLATVRKLFDWRIGEWDWSWLGDTADALGEGAEAVKKGVEKLSPKEDDEPPVPHVRQPREKRSKTKYPVNAELPPVSLLDPPHPPSASGNDAEAMGAELMKKLKEFGVVATLTSIVEGPAVTQFAIKPGHGVRVDKFTGLSRDLQLALKAKSLRVFAPIPGQEAVGIQVSNPQPQPVLVREIVESEKWQNLATTATACCKTSWTCPTRRCTCFPTTCPTRRRCLCPTWRFA